MMKIRPDLVDMQWSYGDERRALHYAVMKRMPEMAVERDIAEIVAIIDEEERKRRETRMSAAPSAASPQAGSENAVALRLKPATGACHFPSV